MANGLPGGAAPGSPPPWAIITQAKILERPPQAPKRKRRPESRYVCDGAATTIRQHDHGVVDDDDDEPLGMPRLPAVRRKLFVDENEDNVPPIINERGASPSRVQHFRPIIPPDEDNGAGRQQQDGRPPSIQRLFPE